MKTFKEFISEAKNPDAMKLYKAKWKLKPNEKLDPSDHKMLDRVRGILGNKKLSYYDFLDILDDYDDYIDSLPGHH